MPAHARADQTARRLHTVAIQLLRRVRRDDPATGLSAPRASALSVLVFGGARSIGELAAAEQVAPPTMTRLVAGLEADGYVTRRADARDGRVVRVSATARGRRVLEAGRDRRVRHVVSLLAQLSPHEVTTVAEAVTLLEQALSEERAGTVP
jgi:DNA-binding MarR family transcriptional regulator